MEKAYSVLVIGLLLLVCAHVPAQDETPALGLIKGKVTDTQAPRPNNIPDAIVIVKAASVTTLEGLPAIMTGEEVAVANTDSAGNYEILNLLPGEYVVIIDQPGYMESKDYVMVLPGEVAFHDVRLYKQITVMSYFSQMGTTRWALIFHFLLLLCSIPITAVYIARRIKRLGKLRSNTDEAFVSRVREALQNGDILGAVFICDEAGGLSNLLKAGLLRYIELSGRSGVMAEDMQRIAWGERIREAIEESGNKVKEELRSRWLLIVIMFAVIGGMALLYGSFGTVVGTNRAYMELVNMGTGDPTILAAGISKAWLAAPLGLLIALISANLCLIAFIICRILDSRANALVSRIQRTFVEMVDSLFAAQSS